jgi:hypothetical protein
MASFQNTPLGAGGRDLPSIPIHTAMMNGLTSSSRGTSGLEVLAEVAEAQQHHPTDAPALTPRELAHVDNLLRVANGHPPVPFVADDGEQIAGTASTQVDTAVEHGITANPGNNTQPQGKIPLLFAQPQET